MGLDFKEGTCYGVLQGTKSFLTKSKGKKSQYRHSYKKFEATGKSTKFCKAPVLKYGSLDVTRVVLMPLGAQTWQINTLLKYLNQGLKHTRGQSQTQRNVLWSLARGWIPFLKAGLRAWALPQTPNSERRLSGSHDKRNAFVGRTFLPSTATLRLVYSLFQQLAQLCEILQKGSLAPEAHSDLGGREDLLSTQEFHLCQPSPGATRWGCESEQSRN